MIHPREDERNDGIVCVGAGGGASEEAVVVEMNDESASAMEGRWWRELR
jgi:hypothetical protein